MHFWPVAIWCCRRRARTPVEHPQKAQPAEPEPLVPISQQSDGSVCSDDDRSKQGSLGSLFSSRPGSSNLAHQSNETASDQSSSMSREMMDDDVCGFWKPNWYHIKSMSSSGSSSGRLPSEIASQEEGLRLLPTEAACSSEESPGGSFGHPLNCSPCVFFANRSRCKAGKHCGFCHLPHVMTQVRRRLRGDADASLSREESASLKARE